MKKILFTGGGSAGHVIPNLAIMRELRYSHEVLYIGTGGIEKNLVENADFPFFQVDCPKLIRSLTFENLKIPFRLHRAVNAAREILEREKPDLVFSKGGFASYPAARAAQKLGIPVLTHESDLSAGLCTKLIAKRCRYVLTSFPETAQRFANGRYVGSPVRREVLSGEKTRARKKFGLEGSAPVLLVLGGGSGSRALNEGVRNHLPALLSKLRILHLCGKGNLMQNPPAGYVQREFESDMGGAFACADLVLSRAGSNTVFEVLALKKPAVFVPLERGSRGDQVENAAYFKERGLCKVLRESELYALPQTISETLSDEALKSALRTCDIGSGTQNVLSVIREVLT